MTTIDDILNAHDSDDDEINLHKIDLELLLQSKDDSDSDDDPVFSSHNNVLPPANDTQSSSFINPVNMQKVSTVFPSQMALPSKRSFDSKVNPVPIVEPKGRVVLPVLRAAFDDATLNSLEMADLREQRFLKTGSNEAVSALQTKRNSSIFNTYSNFKLDDMPVISSQLKRNGNYKQHGPGSATCLLVHAKFVAVGTSRGLVILFDHSQEIRQVIGSSVQLPARSAAAVTSLDVTWTVNNTSLILCGHASGEIALWDVLKGTVIKRINDLHQSKIVKASFIRCIGEGLHTVGTSSISSDLIAVTVDAKGIMHRTRFAKALWTAFTSESECLLDGTSGVVLDMCVVSPFNVFLQQQSSSNSDKAQELTSQSPQPLKLFSGLLGTQVASQYLAFNFATQTCVVQVAPFVKIIHKWPAPVTGKTDGNGNFACLDWSWKSSGVVDSDRQHDAVLQLVRCWGSCVELMEMGTNSITSSTATATSTGKEGVKYDFKVLYRTQFDGQQFVSAKWLTSSRVLLISFSSVYILSNALELVEQSQLPTGLLISSLESKSLDDTFFLNSTCVSGRYFYIMCEDMLFRAQLQSCFELAHSLIHNGQWLEALALILENVSKSPSLLATDTSEIDKCIIRYVELAVRQPTVSSASAISLSQSRNHYHLVAGVCIEYCVATKRLDLLYGELFDNFTAAHQDHIFLESLEPHILSKAITCLPPNIIAQFFDSALNSNRLPSIERCVTYFDIHSVDLNFVTRFLFQHHMYSSFLYAFAYGIGDFVGAFQLIFVFMMPQNSCDDGVTEDQQEDLQLPAGVDAYPSPDQADVGYKLLLFLSYTFEGRVFPRGDRQSQNVSVLMNLLSLVMDKNLRLTPTTFQPLSSQLTDNNLAVERLSGDFPYLTCLSYVDPEAVLLCLHKGLSVVQERSAVVEADVDSSFDQLPVILGNLYTFCVQSRSDEKLSGYNMCSLFLDKFMILLCACVCPLLEDLLKAVVKHASLLPDKQSAEALMIKLAEKQSRYSYNGMVLRQELCTYNFWTATLSIRQTQGAVTVSSASFEKALKHYLVDSRGTAASKSSPQVFEYITHQFQQLSVGDFSEQRYLFCKELVRVIAELYLSDAKRTIAVACIHLTGLVPDIIAYTKHDTSCQFALLNAMVNHLQQQSHDDSLPTFKDCFPPKTLSVYFKLLATSDPSQVYLFLQRHVDLCQLDECLAVCKEQGISDALAYLLERQGDVSSALSTLQRDLSQKIKFARRDIDTQLRVDQSAHTTLRSTNTKESDHQPVRLLLSMQGAVRTEAIRRLPMYSTLSAIVNCAGDLCSTHNEAGNQTMWFSLFDHLLIERQNIRSGTVSSSGEIMILLIGLLLQSLMGRMKAGGVVTPQDIIRRVTTTSHAAGVRLGEFRDVMTNMLTSNEHELLLNQTVNRLIRSDLSALHSKKMAKMRHATFYSAEQSERVLSNNGSDELDLPSVTGNDTQSSSYGKRNVNRGKKRFRKYCEMPYQQLNQGLLTLTCLPPAIGSYSSDFETRRPGSLPLRATFTAEMT